MVFWLADERAHAGEERLQIALWEGQSSLQRRLEETERIRTDLIGTVSHEFRTPLTGIRGSALTLLKRGERLDGDGRRQLLEGILDHQARLSRLLENVLTASRATAADHSAVAEVDEVAAEVAMIAGAQRPESPRISTYVEQGTLARMDRHALHQVLANLLDNAQQHGRPGGQPVVAGGHDGDGIWITVTNEGSDLDPTAARLLFEPFTQADTGPTRSREGLGMGLYVVRRLVEVYGGTVAVRAENGWITVEVRLRPAEERRQVLRLPEGQAQEPTAVPIPKVTSAAAPPSTS
jgi:K+-sensing histidine kinase KdpD